MEDQLKKISDFFKGQQTLYGNRLLLDKKIIDSIEEIQYESAMER